ncbi:MAG: hypothetical protein GEV07_19775 [Streptosporangiales bacterium]|nr:hypothetical protein [Streptosporangiales bacterium]
MNWSATHPRTTTAGEIPDRRPVWFTYFEPRTPVLRNKLGLRNPEALNAYERGVSGVAFADLAQREPPERFDLSYLKHCHRERFGDVYPSAGDLRIVDIAKPTDRERPFLRHTCIETHFRVLTEQLGRDGELRALTDPRQWADRAGYYWAEINNCHPLREENGRAARLYVSQLAKAGGHHLDWARIRHDLGQEAVGVASWAGARADYEPMRALLQYAATGEHDRASAPRRHLDALDRALGDELYSRIAIHAGLGRPDEQEHLDRARTAGSRHSAALPGQYAPQQPPGARRWNVPAGIVPGRERTRTHGDASTSADRRPASGSREPGSR